MDEAKLFSATIKPFPETLLAELATKEEHTPIQLAIVYLRKNYEVAKKTKRFTYPEHLVAFLRRKWETSRIIVSITFAQKDTQEVKNLAFENTEIIG